MLERMLLIRRTEEQLGEDFKAQRLPAGVHLYIGQEANAVGVCAHLDDSDWIASTHRGHGHFLAKGGDPSAMIAEIYGRKTGICKGMGGSMHVADISKGILGANGIVGGGMGLITGAALAAQLEGKGGVAVAFFGGGASNQGVVAEALNLSALWKLPLIFVCEHNGFSEFSPASTVTAGVIAERATPYGVPSMRIDGNDVIAVWKAAGAAVARAREGGGPTFIETKTYRIRGHLEAEAAFLDKASYRTQEEIEAWKKRDPIEAFRAHLESEGLMRAGEYAELDARILAQVNAAEEYARASEWPDPAQLSGLMFDGQTS